MTDICNYPECNCPLDMGADNKCLRGLKVPNEAATTAEADAVGLSDTNVLLCCPICKGATAFCGDTGELHSCHLITCLGDCGATFDMDARGENDEFELEALKILCAEKFNSRAT